VQTAQRLTIVQPQAVPPELIPRQVTAIITVQKLASLDVITVVLSSPPGTVREGARPSLTAIMGTMLADSAVSARLAHITTPVTVVLRQVDASQLETLRK